MTHAQRYFIATNVKASCKKINPNIGVVQNEFVSSSIHTTVTEH